MTGSPLGYGIDFGTSNSLISVAWPEEVSIIDVGSRRVPENLPSVVYLHKDGNRAAGDPAIEQFLVSAGVDSRLLVGLKNDLSDPSLTGTSSWGRFYRLEALIGVVLGRLKAAADAQVGTKIDRVVLGHPVAFVGTEGEDYEELQATAMRRLIAGAEAAGFTDIETLEEPAAAVQEDETPEGIVVSVDFGGGTFDVAVVEYSPEDAEVTALQGAAIGGQHFDQLLFNAMVAPDLGLKDVYVDDEGTEWRLPARFAARSRSMLDIRGLMNEPRVPEILSRFKSYAGGSRLGRFERLLFGGFAFHFYEAIEQAKIDLSQHDKARIEFHRPGFDIDVPVTRKEFESLIEPGLLVIGGAIDKAMAQSGAGHDDVVKVVRTGGSSSIPAFVELLAERFGRSKLQAAPPYTAVVRGLGCYAQGVWG